MNDLGAVTVAVGLMVLLGAGAGGCGTVVERGAGNDAGAARTDASEPDAFVLPRGQVTVTVKDEGIAVPGALVFFNDPDGSPVGNAVTDDTGSVVLDGVAAGGSVTMTRAVEAEITLESVLAVQPGDDITFDTSSFFVSLPSQDGSITINLPSGDIGNDGVDEVVKFEAQSTCRYGSPPMGSPNTQITLALAASCPDSNDVDIAIYGIDDEGHRALAAGKTGVSDGSTITFQSTDLEPVIVHRLTLPAADATAEVAVQAVSSDRAWDSQVLHPPLSDDPVSVSFAYAAGLFDEMWARIKLQPDTQTTIAEVESTLFGKLAVTAAAGDTVDIDTTDHFPFLTALAISGDEVPRLTWELDGTSTTCGSLGDPDVVYATFVHLADNEIDLWKVAAPASAGNSIEVPRLSPAVRAILWPTPPDELRAVLRLVATSDLNYDSFRNGPSANDVTLYAPGIDVGVVHCETTAQTPQQQ